MPGCMDRQLTCVLAASVADETKSAAATILEDLQICGALPFRKQSTWVNQTAFQSDDQKSSQASLPSQSFSWSLDIQEHIGLEPFMI